MRHLISLTILLLFIWLIWSYSGRNMPLTEAKGHISVVQEINPSDSLKRNVVGVQPYMEVADYFSQEKFHDKLRIYMIEADQNGFTTKNTIVLFPEYIGTWLVLEGEKHVLAKKETMADALTTMVLSNLFDFSLAYLKTNKEEDRAASAIFRMKAKSMAKSYYLTFSELAKASKIHIAAGSIILPDPTVVDGIIHVDPTGPLYNAAFVFGPDGKVIGDPILKAFPIESEIPFLTAGIPGEIPTFNLPFAKTSVLVCADSWYPAAYQSAAEESAELILVPSFCTGNGAMDILWKGYSGNPEPAGTDMNDVNKLTEGEAWVKYALPGQIQKTRAQAGLNVFLRGNLWDLGSDGQPLAIFQNKLLQINPADSAGIWSLNY
ncbi:MAG: carbon-nitrogen hydrolase [Algoriphagus sp.]|nr:carbon-nitrogen hydrolase [Algoriphagus sp.]